MEVYGDHLKEHAQRYGMPKLTKLKINKYINKYTKKCKKVHINEYLYFYFHIYV